MKKIIDTLKRKAGIGEKRVYDIAELDQIAEYAEDMDAYFNVSVDEEMTLPMILIGEMEYMYLWNYIKTRILTK